MFVCMFIHMGLLYYIRTYMNVFCKCVSGYTLTSTNLREGLQLFVKATLVHERDKPGELLAGNPIPVPGELSVAVVIDPKTRVPVSPAIPLQHVLSRDK